MRPKPGGTDTDSVDSVEAAIQAAMKAKNKGMFMNFSRCVCIMMRVLEENVATRHCTTECLILYFCIITSSDEGPPPGGPDVVEDQERGEVTSGGIKKSGMVKGEGTGEQAQSKMGKSNVEDSKKGRPAAALRFTLESDEESCVVSAGAEASDEDDFDFYDKF